MHPDLQVIRVWWPKFARKEDEFGRTKAFSSVIIELASPEGVNEVVTKGLVSGGNLLHCTRWERNAELRQCFNCQGYGHTGRTCKREARCGHCAGRHNTRQHPTESRAKKCAVCNGSHEAWYKDCPRRGREYQRVQQRIQSKPALYETGSLRSPRASQPIVDKDGFRVVQKSSKKRKAGEETEKVETPQPRPRGRPTKLSQKEAGQRTLLSGTRRTVSAEGRAANAPQTEDVQMIIGEETPLPSTNEW